VGTAGTGAFTISVPQNYVGRTPAMQEAGQIRDVLGIGIDVKSGLKSVSNG